MDGIEGEYEEAVDTYEEAVGKYEMNHSCLFLFGCMSRIVVSSV